MEASWREREILAFFSARQLQSKANGWLGKKLFTKGVEIKMKQRYSTRTVPFYCGIKNVMFQLERHSSLRMKHKYNTEQMVTSRAVQVL